MNVIVQDLGITIRQLHIAPQSDERKEAMIAIKELDIEGVTITADAIHTCASAAHEIVKKKAFLFCVKENKKLLRELIEKEFIYSAQYCPELIRAHTTGAEWLCCAVWLSAYCVLLAWTISSVPSTR